MSGGDGCKCRPPAVAGQSKTMHQRRMETWAVVTRHANSSAFNGYRTQYSAYSLVRCTACGAQWRTSNAYVEQLPDVPARDRAGANWPKPTGVRGVPIERPLRSSFRHGRWA